MIGISVSPTEVSPERKERIVPIIACGVTHQVINHLFIGFGGKSVFQTLFDGGTKNDTLYLAQFIASAIMTSIELLPFLQFITHYGLHFLFPGLVAWIFFRKKWKKAWLIMIATMLVDLDHLLADPIFDPTRCSVGFHPLHSYYAIAVYAIMVFFPKLRIVAVGLLLHMATDFQDCLWG